MMAIYTTRRFLIIRYHCKCYRASLSSAKMFTMVCRNVDWAMETAATGAVKFQLTSLHNSSRLTALLVYEYYITLSDEVHYIWGKKFSVVSVLFLVNRYTTLLYRGLRTIELVQWPWLSSDYSRAQAVRHRWFSIRPCSQLRPTHTTGNLDVSLHSSTVHTKTYKRALVRCTYTWKIIAACNVVMYLTFTGQLAMVSVTSRNKDLKVFLSSILSSSSLRYMGQK